MPLAATSLVPPFLFVTAFGNIDQAVSLMRAGSTRMRIWRALRSMGAAVLRDGVYLLPASPGRYQALQHQANAIQALGGKSLLLEVGDSSMETTEVLPALFDRNSDYQELLEAVVHWRSSPCR